ncbi:MAG: NAD-dependent DNA ligase LigA [Lachnospiraceae bacterium]|nr:NAD-dependent DNA ligase LigA [Lachnospiraceae bacterium]MBP3297369.1 NAD-dependent DNA ligase LigA [Lachnospiraceae bacterium]
MRELVDLLRRASQAYYAEDIEIMPNVEYDRLYDELQALEEKTGVVLAGSPTVSVGYEAVDSLPKERHASPMLSLGKTKSREELASWLGDHDGLLSWKEDGLTVVLTYRNGMLEKCVTRGNGEVGEVVTPNARTFVNLPHRIAFRGELVVRGEAVITYSDFERVNAQIPEEGAKYKNPRNLCSGSVRQLNSEITAQRNVRVILFRLVSAEGVDFDNSMEKQFAFLKEQGFETVEYERVNAQNVIEAVGRFEERIRENDIPSDGLVLSYDDLAYAESLGRTAKFPRGAIAFKWADEMAETELLEVEWNTSRTGLINPVAVFAPVELEGTTVSRASVHNVSIIRELALGIGDKIKVYKANMIIPQIAENLTKSGTLELPKTCPVCGGETVIKKEADSEVLYCSNKDCPAKHLKAFVHFVERDAMNIEGLSEATLEKLIGAGLVHRFCDIYHLRERRDEVRQLEGFHERSTDNLLQSIEKSRALPVARMLYALGIPGIGLANAKLIARHFSYDLEQMKQAQLSELSEIDNVGPVLAEAFYGYMHDAEKMEELNALVAELEFTEPEESNTEQTLAGAVFVITGSLNRFENRNELKALIEARGGKVTGKVTGKTLCLINNDAASQSTKNKEAKALGVRIVTEDEFLAEFLPEI